MADTVKTAHDLKLLTIYTNGDYRTLTFPNPKQGLTESVITGAMSGMSSILISDNRLRSGEVAGVYDYTKAAKYTDTTYTTYDLINAD